MASNGDTSINVMVYGVGAIGSVYAFILSRCANVRLTVVARSNYEAVKKHGMKINSENHGEHVFNPHDVVKTPSDAPGPFDYIVISAKATDQSSLARALLPIITCNTTLVLLQNGVGNELPFRVTFPESTILSCIAWTGAYQPSPGVVQHTKSENLQIGIYLNPNISILVENQRLLGFTDLLSEGKTPHEILSPDDLQIKRWEKCIWNCGVNCLTTLTRVKTHEWLDSSPEAEGLTRKLIQEMTDVAHMSGIDVEAGLVERLMTKMKTMPSIRTSMMTDALEGRKFEVDVILGTPVRRGRELGVKMDVAETIYTLLVALDRGLRDAETEVGRE